MHIISEMINPKRADFEIMAIIGPFTMSFDIANIRDGRDAYSDIFGYLP